MDRHFEWKALARQQTRLNRQVLSPSPHHQPHCISIARGNQTSAKADAMRASSAGGNHCEIGPRRLNSIERLPATMFMIDPGTKNGEIFLGQTCSSAGSLLDKTNAANSRADVAPTRS